MRTTIRIDDELFRAVKLHAAGTGRTIGEVVEDALRQSLARRRSRAEAAPLPTFGGSGLLPGVDLDDTAALRDLMGDCGGLDALR